jgi:hypothetical protein
MDALRRSVDQLIPAAAGKKTANGQAFKKMPRGRACAARRGKTS